jgi:hypothetical protein
MRTRTARERPRPIAVTRTDWTTAREVTAGGTGVVVVVTVVVPVLGVVVVLVVVEVLVGAVVVVLAVDVAGAVEVVEDAVELVVDIELTLNVPCISYWCGSQKKLYVPGESVTSQLVLPVASTLVARSTPPGPSRWKLWMVALSLTFTVYGPGASVVTGAPFWVNEIVKPGPTVAFKTGPAACPGAATNVAAA